MTKEAVILGVEALKAADTEARGKALAMHAHMAALVELATRFEGEGRVAEAAIMRAAAVAAYESQVAQLQAREALEDAVETVLAVADVSVDSAFDIVFADIRAERARRSSSNGGRTGSRKSSKDIFRDEFDNYLKMGKNPRPQLIVKHLEEYARKTPSIKIAAPTEKTVRNWLKK
jgi:hypothetical protein